MDLSQERKCPLTGKKDVKESFYHELGYSDPPYNAPCFVIHSNPPSTPNDSIDLSTNEGVRSLN